MNLNRQNKVILAMAFFMFVGTVAVFLTHERSTQTSKQVEVDSISVGDYAGYVENIRPWLQEAFRDQSVDTVARIKFNLLSVKSEEKDIGEAHMSLFLAFESWEKFLDTQQESYRLQASQRLATVAELMPELAIDIEQLNQLLN